MVVECMALLGLALVLQRIPFVPLLMRCWRPAVACAVMAGVLWSAGLAWTGWPEPFAASAVRLVGSAAIGASAYAGALWALWTLAGRPDGAEADMLGTMARLVSKAQQRLARA